MSPAGPFLCTLLMLVSGLVLLICWSGGLNGVDQGAVAIVFAGALVGRCILATKP